MNGMFQCLADLESCSDLLSFDEGRSDVIACLMGDEEVCAEISEGPLGDYPCHEADRALLDDCYFAR